ncbi:MAG TPA: HesA/MoeB/ThiF family protein [Dissulfurispiraceae bacterium]|nr:HesA/MoeB/ThiF family protein [Dissulfurispiraceae bacterium]
MLAQLNTEDMERFKRQLTLNGYTKEHQIKLKNSTALIAGVGGVGGTTALYLAIAGIGRLKLVHSGALTSSNLNRQILMTEDWIGKARVDCAKETIHRIASGVTVDIYNERMIAENTAGFVRDSDIAVSARPNFPERCALNAACIKHNVPMVEGAMFDMDAYLFSIKPGITPCFHCLFKDADHRWQELGFPVLGALSGTLGCMMAVEAIKVITGYGSPLYSKMLLFNLANMDFNTIAINRNPRCQVCGSPAKREGEEI